MPPFASTKKVIPGLPVLGWSALNWAAGSEQGLPCVLDHPRAHYTTSGRAAILLALQALRLAPGSRVAVPSYHCPTMVAPVAALGLEAVFYPVDANGTILRDWLDQQGDSGLNAILAPHYFGRPQPMAGLRRWCDTAGVALIEDCAHTLFGNSDGRPVGQWGDVAIASLTKFIPVNEGGLLMLNRIDLQPPVLTVQSLVQELRAAIDIVDLATRHGKLPGLNMLFAGALNLFRALCRQDANTVAEPQPEGAADPGQGRDGFNIDLLKAHQSLTHVARFVTRHAHRQGNAERRRRNYEHFAALLPTSAGLRPLFPRLPTGAVPYVFPLWVSEPDPAYLTLKSAGTPLFRWDWHWPGVPDLPGDHGKTWSHHVIQVPCHQDLLPRQVEEIAAALRMAFGARV